MEKNKKIIYAFLLSSIILIVGLSIMAHQYSRRYKALKKQTIANQANLITMQEGLTALENKFEEQSRVISILAIGTSIDNSFFNNSDIASAAKTLCDIVYHETPKPAEQTPRVKNLSLTADPYMVYREAIKHKSTGHTCAGHTYLLISMLEAKGIPARQAVMVETIEHSRNSHTTMEFYNGTKWLALDPTFNIMWKKSGTDEYLSYAELYDAYKADIPVEPVFIGTKKIPGKTIEEYYISTKDLLGYLAVAPATVFTSNGPVKFSAEVRPGDWDGYLIDKDGQKYNHLLRISTFYEKVVGDIR